MQAKLRAVAKRVARAVAFKRNIGVTYDSI